MTLTEFLEARIVVDEAAVVGMDARSVRVAAECETKRAIIAIHLNTNDGDCETCVTGGWGYPTHGGAHPEQWPCPTLRALGYIYAGHPDYLPEWRP